MTSYYIIITAVIVYFIILLGSRALFILAYNEVIYITEKLVHNAKLANSIKRIANHANNKSNMIFVWAGILALITLSINTAIAFGPTSTSYSSFSTVFNIAAMVVFVYVGIWYAYNTASLFSMRHDIEDAALDEIFKKLDKQ